jgi:hypothetical protein
MSVDWSETDYLPLEELESDSGGLVLVARKKTTGALVVMTMPGSEDIGNETEEDIDGGLALRATGIRTIELKVYYPGTMHGDIKLEDALRMLLEESDGLKEVPKVIHADLGKFYEG